MFEEKEIKAVSEAERTAVEAALEERFGEKIADGRGGNSPYSPETVIYGPPAAAERGARIQVAPICRSHDGKGQYKNRGRWRTVYAVAPKADSEFAVCTPTDRDARAIGDAPFCVRPWETHEAEEATGGLGGAAPLLAAAFEELGL